MAESKQEPSKGLINKFLNGIEWVGNKLPAPALLFFYSMLGIMVLSWPLSAVDFSFTTKTITGESVTQVEHVSNLLSGEKLIYFLENFVRIFINFAPLGVVVVAMLGIGVAERAGYVDVGLKKLLRITPKKFLTPMVLFVAMLSHFAADAGYVVVIPIGGILFYAAGRHPIAGIAAAFAGVSAGFSANLIPSTNDILLQGITQDAARILDPNYTVNVLSNWAFGSASVFFLVIVGWFVTDKIVEPRLSRVPLNDEIDIDDSKEITPIESRAFWISSLFMVGVLAVFTLWAWPADSLLRADLAADAGELIRQLSLPDNLQLPRGKEWPILVEHFGLAAGTSSAELVNYLYNEGIISTTRGSLTSAGAPLMRSIVAIIFLGFIIPGIVFGMITKRFKKLSDVVDAMSETTKGMSSFIVMMFFCAFFLEAFNQSNLGKIIALSGAEFLQSINLNSYVTIICAILFIAFINLFVGSASAKWILLSPILVPMLMQLGIAPELTQAAYRVGDSTTNIISPLMTYFALVVVYCQRYVKSTGIGTLISMMIPYSISFLLSWIVFLMIWWLSGMPLGIEGAYLYNPHG